MRPIKLLLAAFAALNMMVVSVSASEDGIVRKQSAYGVYATIDRLKTILEEKGLTVFADIDHSAGAKRAGLDLRPTRLLIFGNPKLGTPLMQAAATAGLDLPQKALAYRNDEGKVWLIYNDPAYLQGRHAIEGQDDVLKKIGGALGKFTDAAVSE